MPVNPVDVLENFRRHTIKDLYYFLLKISWFHFISFLVVNFLILNVGFAFVYMRIGGVEGLDQESFADSFFFSIQTMSTIGYGAMHPITSMANIIVTIQVLVGIITMSLFTGLMFSKFSRPNSKIVLSKDILVSVRNGKPYLLLRIANERTSGIVQASVEVSFLRFETTGEGERIRKVHNLKLDRSTTPLFLLSWLVLHEIDEHSPLYGLTEEEFRNEDIWLVVSFSGHDPVMYKSIHNQHIYKPEHVKWGYRFKDALMEKSDGTFYIDFSSFHEIEPIED